MKSDFYFSIVIPTYNEEETVGMVLDEVNSLKSKGYNYEILVIDDNSKDKTGDIVKEKGARFITNPNKKGKGSSLLYGFSLCKGKYLIMMDADGSHRANDIPKFLEVLESEKEVGLVIGSRIIGGSDEYTPIKALGNIFFTYLVGLLLKRYLSDALNGFKAFRKEVFDNSVFDSIRFELEVELIANTLRRGLQIKEVSSHERERLGGKAKAKIVKDGLLFLKRIFKEYFRNLKIKKRNNRAS